ncbi:hypothetical protein F2P56_007700 [Juglans regia]|uniref:Uncharacterized protein n=1 Tax=Juglans regia TaxID=51240 RepID=A0A833XSL0_JUGRE|nr:hypothetical protein F2P56_007700 [Juglans regia]
MSEIPFQNPREILELAIGIDLVVNLKLQEDVLPKKCPQRRICSEFGKFQSRVEIGILVLAGSTYSPATLYVESHSWSDDTEAVVKEQQSQLWRTFIVVKQNYRSLTCQESSQNPGQNCWKLSILMTMKRSSLLHHCNISYFTVPLKLTELVGSSIASCSKLTQLHTYISFLDCCSIDCAVHFLPSCVKLRF